MNGILSNKSALRNYDPMPNAVFSLRLKPGELAVYSYLMYIENRKTFQCYPSYGTIGKAVGMSGNTVAKYVRALEAKGLIRTEPTTVPGAEGWPRNGTLLYTVQPIRGVVERHIERQIENARLEAARQAATTRLELFNRRARQAHTCGELQKPEAPEYPGKPAAT